MGKFLKGILGGFSGTIGTVVGGNWKGIDFMRSRPVRRSSNVTLAQEVQRAKFSLVTKFLFAVRTIVSEAYRDFSGQMSQYNHALQYTLKNAVAGEYPDFRIDYRKALIAKGKVPNAAAPAAVSTAPGVINFSWTDNSGSGDAKPQDKAILIAYSELLNQSVYTMEGNFRSVGSAILPVPIFTGHEVQTWIAFIKENGKDVSSSIFTGTVMVN